MQERRLSDEVGEFAALLGRARETDLQPIERAWIYARLRDLEDRLPKLRRDARLRGNDEMEAAIQRAQRELRDVLGEMGG